jgi:hypothetical protein
VLKMLGFRQFPLNHYGGRTQAIASTASQRRTSGRKSTSTFRKDRPAENHARQPTAGDRRPEGSPALGSSLRRQKRASTSACAPIVFSPSCSSPPQVQDRVLRDLPNMQRALAQLAFRPRLSRQIRLNGTC